MAPHSSTLAWKIPWMEEPGRLQSMGSIRVGHNWVTSLSLFTFMHWRRKWKPTPVFLPGESQGQSSLVGVTQSQTWWGDLAAAAAACPNNMTRRDFTSESNKVYINNQSALTYTTCTAIIKILTLYIQPFQRGTSVISQTYFSLLINN